MLLPVRYSVRHHVILPFLILGCVRCVAIDSDSLHLTLHGRASVTAEYYGLRTEPVWSSPSRRPAQLYRLFANPELQYGSITIPFTIMLTAQQTNFTTSVADNQSLDQFIQNPLNILACEPRWKWLTLHLGSYTPHWSELSLGDVQVFGLGVDANPGSLRASVFRGISQRSTEPFALARAQNAVGSYERTMTGLKLGMGSESSGYVDLNIVHVIDDTASVMRPPSDSLVRPEEQLLVSLAGHFVVDSGAVLNVEGAGTLSSRNVYSDLLQTSSIPNVPGFTSRVSSRADLAASAALVLTEKSYALNLQAKYLGGGFVSPGYPQRIADRIELTATPRFSSTGGAVQANATVGYRVNNVSKQQSSSLNQLLLSLNTTVEASESWSFAVSLSNFGIRNTSINDSARIQSVSRFVSLSPTYRFRTNSAFHSLTLNLTLDKYTDDNIISGSFSSNNTVAIFGNYSLNMTSLPLGAQASLNLVNNSSNFLSTTTLGSMLSANYALISSTLLPGLRLAYNHTSFKNGEPSAQILYGVQCSYKLSQRSTLSLNLSSNHISFGTTRPTSYTESMAQFALSTQF